MATQPAILGAMRLGNVRLGYESAALATIRRTRVRILLAGADAATRVRRSDLSIRDIINDAPHTCRLTVDTTAPVPGQDLRITLNSDTPVLLFNGAIQTVDLSYEGRPAHVAWSCTAVDDTTRANDRRPFGAWTNVSATTVAQALIATFAPGFTSAHVQAALPAISVVFDGSDEMSHCLHQIAQLVGGYFYFEDLDLHLFQAEASNTPDPIDSSHPFLDDPPITVSTDRSQLRTRDYGKGHGEALLADVLAGETILPLADAVMFNPAGGLAIASTTPDGAQSQRLAYTGVQLGGGGSLVGPGAAPSTAPTPALAVGVGLGTGTYQYAYTDVTPSGESLPSPLGTITTGLLAAPSSAPGAAAAAGAGLSFGTYQYAYTDVTAAGETLPSPVSSAIATTELAAPSGAPSDNGHPLGGSLTTGTYVYALTYVNANGETTLGPTLSVAFNTAGGVGKVALGIANPPAGATGGWNLYRTVVNGAQLKFVANIGQFLPSYTDGLADGALGANAPTTNTALVNARASLTGIAVGPSGVTSRKMYRTVANGSQLKLLATLADNTTTTYTDSTADGSLGANVPTIGTAVVTQVALGGIAIAASPTTSRKIYRTAVNGSQLKLLTTLADNTTTTYVDATADGSLGADAPTSDGSGLAPSPGQVNAGSSSLLTASAAPFLVTGGWAILSGGQVVRYTGVSGNALTGIPTSGVGSITTTVLHGSPALPAPALTGVSGVSLALAKGAPVHLWVQRDDLAAQSAQVALDAAQGRVSDGVIEHLITDERRGEASLMALCDADLALFSRPIVTVKYATRDVKTKSGKTIVVTLASPPISETLTIQDVTISDIDMAPGLPPTFTVTASSVRFSLEGLLRKALAA